MPISSHCSNLPDQVIYRVMWPSDLKSHRKMVYNDAPYHPIWVTYPIRNIWSHVTIRSEMSSKNGLYDAHLSNLPYYSHCDHHIWNLLVYGPIWSNLPNWRGLESCDSYIEYPTNTNIFAHYINIYTGWSHITTPCTQVLLQNIAMSHVSLPR